MKIIGVEPVSGELSIPSVKRPAKLALKPRTPSGGNNRKPLATRVMLTRIVNASGRPLGRKLHNCVPQLSPLTVVIVLVPDVMSTMLNYSPSTTSTVAAMRIARSSAGAARTFIAGCRRLDTRQTSNACVGRAIWPKPIKLSVRSQAKNTNPYLFAEQSTETDRRTSFRGELNPEKKEANHG